MDQAPSEPSFDHYLALAGNATPRDFEALPSNGERAHENPKRRAVHAARRPGHFRLYIVTILTIASLVGFSIGVIVAMLLASGKMGLSLHEINVFVHTLKSFSY